MKKNTQNNKSTVFSLFLFLALFTPLNSAFPFAFVFAGEANGVTIVTHPIGYTGAGGVVSVTVGINPTSANASDMVISTQNVIAVFNEALSTTGNLDDGPLPSGNIDFESVLLHEMGHSLGLRHCNLATESGLPSSSRDYTQSTDGADNMFNLNPGTDGIIGSADDVRGDDVNLNYFKITDNNPFTIAGTVDQTTYSRDIIDLPSGNFSTNGDRTVAGSLGFPNTEAVMQQLTFTNEQQQTLTADDVAGLKYAMAGLDEIAGTADDYTLELEYVGLSASADIVIDFDNNETGFAVSQNGGVFVGADHIAITNSNIFFNTGFSWYFNTIALAAPPAIVCAPYTTSLGVDGTVTIQGLDVDGGTTDSNGDSFTLSVTPAAFTCAEVGDNTVTLTATDTNGMSSSCTTIVTITESGDALAAICQNPTVALDAAGSATITTADIDGGSTVGNCGFESTYMSIGAPMQNSLTTTFGSNNGAQGNMFDIEATNDITINSFDVNMLTGVTADIEVYFKTGTWVGFDSTPDDWTLLAIAPGVVSSGTNVPTLLNLNLGINVNNGYRVAFYVTFTNTSTNADGFRYTNGVQTGNLFASDTNLAIYEGAGKRYPFTNTFQPRNFNGNIIYTTPVLFDGNFDCSDVGANTITLNVKDTTGNIESCDATVTVVDDEGPTMTCPGDEVVNPLSGNTTYEVPDYFALGSVNGTDNCSSALVNTSQNPVAGTLLAFGVYTVTFNAEDENGNVGTCSFELTVEDDGLGVNDEDFNIRSVTLYPNPAKNSITIKNPQGLSLNKVSIYDLSGRLVISESLENMQSDGAINVSKLQSAIYLCIIESDRGQLVKRIIKE